MDRTCHATGARQHHSHSPSLDTRGETQARTTQDHLASDCGSRTEDLTSYLGNHSEAGQGQTGVA